MKYASILLVLLLGTSSVAAVETLPSPETECPVGLVCFTPDEVASLQTKMIELKRDLQIAQSRKMKKIGQCVGPGSGLTLKRETGEGLDQVELDLTVGMYWVWGWRFK